MMPLIVSLSRPGNTSESCTGRAGMPRPTSLSRTTVIMSDSASISLFAWPLNTCLSRVGCASTSAAFSALGLLCSVRHCDYVNAYLPKQS